ncbi:MAG: hypothetical protein PHF37_06435 [Phycisphaerae bacterium]|nr:hypothetical protein [Phycisphaerae bacterium]
MKKKLLGVCLLAIAGNALAFDCSKAFLQTDFVICSSPDLLKAETDLEKLWHLFLSDKDEVEKKVILEDQRNWIKQYAERCKVHGKGRPSEAVIEAARPCVKQALGDRADYLSVQIERARIPTDAPTALPPDMLNPRFPNQDQGNAVTPQPVATPAPMSQVVTPPKPPPVQHPSEDTGEETYTKKLLKKLWHDWFGK